MSKSMDSYQWATLAVFEQHYTDIMSKWEDSASHEELIVLSYFKECLENLNALKP